jgi:protein-S-isoprenylcysteine O-methyltransferase Ste14
MASSAVALCGHAEATVILRGLYARQAARLVSLSIAQVQQDGSHEEFHRYSRCARALDRGYFPYILSITHRSSVSLLTRIGAWAFHHRSWLPVPLALILAVVRVGEWEGEAPIATGALLVIAGLTLRLWAVRHIGVISRTRANRHGALLTTGPYAIVRNPLYCANWLLWTGFTLDSELVWMLPAAWLVFALQYSAIVSWEESRMHEQFGTAYEAYVKAVPRWLPSWGAITAVSSQPVFGWGAVFFSERGTLIAAGCMVIVLMLKEAAG